MFRGFQTSCSSMNHLCWLFVVGFFLVWGHLCIHLFLVHVFTRIQFTCRKMHILQMYKWMNSHKVNVYAQCLSHKTLPTATHTSVNCYLISITTDDCLCLNTAGVNTSPCLAFVTQHYVFEIQPYSFFYYCIIPLYECIKKLPQISLSILLLMDVSHI